jgi:hypothetical protein
MMDRMVNAAQPWADLNQFIADLGIGVFHESLSKARELSDEIQRKIL